MEQQLGNHTQESAPIEATPSFDNQTSSAPDTTSSFDSEPSFDSGTPTQDFDVIRYNKQEVKIPVSERQTYLQKGYNYDKLQSQYQEAQKQAQYLDRLATMQGFNNTGEFLTALEQYEQEQRIQQEAQKLGVDDHVIRDHLYPLKNELEQIKRQNELFQRQEMERQVASELQRMREKYSDFDQYRDSIAELVQRGYALEDAYRLSSYDNVYKRIEQEVLKNVRDRGERQVLSSKDRATPQNMKPQNMSLEDIEQISARVARGERISF